MKYLLLAFAIFIVGLTLANKAFALSSPTSPFGGKVVSIVNPSVVCSPPGVGPVLMKGTVMTGFDQFYFYLPNPKKAPKVNGYILGRHLLVPSTQYCQSSSGGSPYPVLAPSLTTPVYGVSR